MADNNLSGVTTRDLDTTNDNARSKAIANRSNLATQYTDQFRADRNSMRRGGEIRNTTAGAIPAASGGVTQSQDVAIPGSFEDVLIAADGTSGDQQDANQIINPGPDGGGGGSSGGSSGGGGGGGSGSGSDSGQYGSGSGGPRTGTSAGGNYVEGSDVDRYYDNENDPIYESAEYQPGATTPVAGDGSNDSMTNTDGADSRGIVWTTTSREDGGTSYTGTLDGEYYGAFSLRPDGTWNSNRSWLNNSWTYYSAWRQGSGG